MEQTSNKWYILLICVVLMLATFWVYAQVGGHEFVDFDDYFYITENPQVLGGITVESVKWAFTSGYASNWHPLTWISHMLDCQLFGIDAGRHHLTSLFFHLVNTLLLFWVLKKMTAAVWPSAFVAALFALHPMHVESVAWISERKDVLSTFFWLLTIAAYIRYSQRRSAGRYLLALLLFAMGLMAKPMLVTLPFVLLLLDYWPLQRFEFQKQNKAGSLVYWPLIKEKIPFFALVGGSCAITFFVQQSGGAVLAKSIEKGARVSIS